MSSRDETQQDQQQMFLQLQVEAPVQRESLLGRHRVYQSWEGENIFCCGGRLMTGPEPLHLGVSVLLLLAPCFLFYQTVLPLIAAEQQLACSVIVLTLLTISLLLLFVVAFTDPGIIPRGAGDPGNRRKECVVNGQTILLKWCSTCKVFRPPRAKHCFVCNNCVAAFDHHCPWISNCVGQRNRRSFLIFIFLCTSLSVALSIGTALAVKAEIERAQLALGLSSLWQILTTRKALGVEAAFSGIVSLPLLNLVGFNCYLIAKNLTTAEEFHQPYGNRNPFSEGWKRNCYLFWFSNPAPRAIDFRSFTDFFSGSALATSDPLSWQPPLTSIPSQPIDRFDTELATEAPQTVAAPL